LFTVLAALLIVAFGFELWDIRESASGPRVFRDTRFYSVPEGTSYFSALIWGGARSPVAMLVFKLCADDRERIVDLSYILGFVGWASLAAALAYAARPAYMKPIAAAVVLSLALARGVLEWNHVMLGDGVAISSVALCAACGVLFLTAPSRATLLLLTLGAAVCALARDSSAYALLSIAALVALIAGTRSLFTRRLDRWSLAAAGALFLGALAGYASAESAGRSGYPLVNVIASRVITDPEATAFFVRRGMPKNDALLPGRARRAYGSDERLADFREWTYEHGKPVYIAYLLARPVEAIREAYENYPDVVAGNVRGYGVKRLGTHSVLDDLWDRSHLAPHLGVIALGVIAALARPRIFANAAVVVGVLAGIGTLPHAFVVYHGDAMEVPRHGVAAAAELRVAIALLVPGLASALSVLAHRTAARVWNARPRVGRVRANA
jgi:hypothetical protein